MQGSCEVCLPSPGGGRDERSSLLGRRAQSARRGGVTVFPHPTVPKLRDHPTPSRISLRSCEPTLPLQGRVRRKRSILSFARRDGLLRRFAPLRKRFAFVAGNDVDRHGSIFPRRDSARVVLEFSSPQKSEGAGKAGCWLAPAVSCAISARKTHTSIQVSAGASGLPCAMVLRLMPCSPWRRIRLASIAGELTARIARLSFANLRRLDTSNGCQDHTVLPYANSRHSSGALAIAHGKTRPAIYPSRAWRCRVHRSPAQRS